MDGWLDGLLTVYPFELGQSCLLRAPDLEVSRLTVDFQSECSPTQHTPELFLWVARYVCMHGFVWCLPRWLTGKWPRANHALSVSVCPKPRLGEGDALCEAGFPGSARIPPSVASRAWRRPVLGSGGGPEHRSSGPAMATQHQLLCTHTIFCSSPSNATLGVRPKVWRERPRPQRTYIVCPGGG